MADAVSRRYAQALVEVAAESDAVDQVGRDLDRFVAVYEGQEGLRDVLGSPVFTTDERRLVLEKVIARLGMSRISANVLRLINDKGRMPVLSRVALAYRDLADERAGRIRVTVQTAEPLSPQLEAEVRAALERMTGKTVIVSSEVHPELIGGIVARIGDKVYDSSLRTRLEIIKQSLLNTSLGQPAQA